MQTHIEIDERLADKAMQMAGARTKSEAVDMILRRFIQEEQHRMERQKDILQLKGKINWVGNLDEMRRD